MMRAKRFLLLAILIFGICGGISAKTLVAYYSFTNNVRTIVNELATQKEVDILEILPAEEGLDYAANNYALGTQLLNAIKAAPNDADSYPAIKAVSVDLSEYDDIIVATPLWWSQMAAPIQTFLFNYGSQMAGKRVSLIVSSASSGISQVVNDAKRLVPDAIWTGDALWINNKNRTNTASLLSEWLKTWGDKRIVVISDTHVMAPELLVSEGEAWTNYISGHPKMLDYSQPLFDEMVTKIKDEIKPDLVLITGDLTKDGEQLSHSYVINKLDELREAGIQTLVIPGNHDRGANAGAVSFDGENTTAVAVADDDWFATQYANYGYGTSSERESTSLTYACEPIEGLVVIGIDSGTEGSLSSATLEWIVGKALAAKESGNKVIAMMHHPLIPHFTGVENFVEWAVLKNYETVRNTLADAGIKVVFTGHFHTSDIAMDKNADLSREIYDVTTGSLISYPCDYREVTLSNDLSELSITTGHMKESLPKRINVTDGSHSVTFELNGTSAARALYDMLPVTKDVQNYSTNEKIFYPETAISYSSDCIEDDCPAGTLALFSPWGNVVMYYGDAGKYNGLYVLGEAVEGADQISELSGNITVTQVEFAKERFRTAAQNQVAARGMAYSIIAPKAAEAFLIHAEGNEPDNANAATVLSQLESAADMGAMLIGADKAQAFKDMANSMLKDLNQYGVEGRENVTDDLSLTVKMADKYKLKYQIGDEVFKTVELVYGSKILQTWTYLAPSKEGHTFSGWSEIPETMPAHDVTITGSYTANKYKLVYQVDGETFKSLEVSYGSTVTPEEEPSQEGYTFSGWSEIPETMPAHDVTITGRFFLLGDANGDGVVNVTDIVEIINFMNMKASAEFNKKAADVTGDGDVDENDINAISSLIMSGN